MSDLTVVCVHTRDYQGRGVEYVNKLASMCRRHVPEHLFVCLADSLAMKQKYHEDVELVPLTRVYNGWWSKLNLFEPGLLSGRKLYLDLDTVLSDDIGDLVEYAFGDPGLWVLDDFRYPLSETKVEHLTPEELMMVGGPGTCNSSVMLWEGDVASDVWAQFSPAAAAGLHGDQNWITRVMGKRLKIIPEGWACSFRYGMSTGPIMVFHGEIKPHQVGGPWMAKHWQ